MYSCLNNKKDDKISHTNSHFIRNAHKNLLQSGLKRLKNNDYGSKVSS